MDLLLKITFILSFFTLRSSSITFTIHCDNKTGPSLPPEFLSVTVGVITDENDFFPFQSTELNTLAKGLSPAYMRFGGTSADQLVYSMTGNIQYESMMTNVTYHINLTLFSDIANFAQRNDWKLIFGLNEQNRKSNNEWNSTNAQQLLEAIKQSNKQNNNNSYIYALELGNEPNLYKGHEDIGYVVVSPEQEAKDFNTLYQLIQTTFNSNDSHNTFIPKIWGNDGADRNSRTYTEEWAQSLYSMQSTHQIDALTFHQYYGSSKDFNLSDYYSVNILDSLIVVLQNITNISDKYFDSNIQIVFGETAASSGGGAANITDTFVDGFMWLDKLGLSSIYGLDAVCRQIFYHGNYGLVRPIGKSKNDLQVTADYWSGYLFKNLVGNKVVYVDNEFEYGRYLRVYAFCTKTHENGSVFNYKHGSVTIMILNLYNNTQTFDIDFIGIGHNTTDDMSYDGYYFTPKDGVINSVDVLLNGQVVKMVNETTFPIFKPVNSPFGTMMKIDPMSYGFVVALNVDALACNS